MGRLVEDHEVVRRDLSVHGVERSQWTKDPVQHSVGIGARRMSEWSGQSSDAFNTDWSLRSLRNLHNRRENPSLEASGLLHMADSDL